MEISVMMMKLNTKEYQSWSVQHQLLSKPNFRNLMMKPKGVQIIETVVTYKQNTAKQSNKHSRANMAVQIVRSEHGLTTIPLGGEGLSAVLLALKNRKEKERKRRQSLEHVLSEQFSIDKKMEQSVDKGCKGVLNISKESSVIDTIPKKAWS